MSFTHQTRSDLDQALRETLIRDLVETWPEMMPVLSQYGIDVCCGGGLTIPDAAAAHGHDPDELLERVGRTVSGEESA